MSEEQQRRNAIAQASRADRAKELLNNPLYQESITVMKAAMYSEFESSSFKDDDTRQELWQRMQLMKLFESSFESIVKQGGKAENTIKMIDAKPRDGLR